ncbi:MAG: oxidoreductase [Ignavibacteriaceae bacterium]
MSDKYFTYKSLDDLRKDVDERGLDITFEDKLEAIARPVIIGGRTVGNSLAIHPMEGCDGTLDGRPDELTFRRWERFGEGGAKLIWGEATAVVPEGRANPRQLFLSEKNLFDFENLLKSARKKHKEVYGIDYDLMIGLQLTHSGRYSYPKPIIAYHHPQVDSVTYVDKDKKIIVTSDYPVVTDDYLERLEDSFVEAAKMAAKIGFDFIDIKQCHTYLLNELLGARIRSGKYGGSFENRTRLIRNILGKTKSELGDQIILGSRINAFDGIPFITEPQTKVGRPLLYDIPYEYSFGVDKYNPLEPDLSEVLLLIKTIVESGVQLLNVSLGSPYYNMHLGRPFDNPPIDGYDSPEHPLVGIERHFKVTGEIQKVFPDLPIVGTGYSWLQKYLVNAAESNLRRGRVSIVGVGRGAIAYPNYAHDALTLGGLESRKVCYGVSFCTNLMRSKHNELGQYPTGCVPRDSVYAEIYKESLKRAKEQKEIKGSKD